MAWFDLTLSSSKQLVKAARANDGLGEAGGVRKWTGENGLKVIRNVACG